jgi:hypothetical protein
LGKFAGKPGRPFHAVGQPRLAAEQQILDQGLRGAPDARARTQMWSSVFSSRLRAC